MKEKIASRLRVLVEQKNNTEARLRQAKRVVESLTADLYGVIGAIREQGLMLQMITAEDNGKLEVENPQQELKVVSEDETPEELACTLLAAGDQSSV